jgi:hypothetical protein
MNAYDASMNVLVDKSIVETIIGILLIYSDNDVDDLINTVNTLSIFYYRKILMKERMLTPRGT